MTIYGPAGLRRARSSAQSESRYDFVTLIALLPEARAVDLVSSLPLSLNLICFDHVSIEIIV